MEPTWRQIDVVGTAICSFNATGEHQIHLTIGDQLLITEQTKGWYRGTLTSTGQKGIFPCSYVMIKDTENFDIILNELTQVVREWGSLLKQYFRERRMAEYKVMKDRLSLLLDWHTKIMSPSITSDVREMLKGKVLRKIEEGRVLMGLDMIVRTASGEPANETNTGLLQLYRMHQELAHSGRPIIVSQMLSPLQVNDENSPNSFTSFSNQPTPMSLTLNATKKAVVPQRKILQSTRENDGPILTASGPSSVNNLFFDLKIFMCSVGEQTELFFSLYSRTENRFITEEFQVCLTANGMPHDIEKIGKLSTVFVEITKKDLASDLWMVCRLIRKGKMLIDNSSKKSGVVMYRRPFGCGVLPLKNNMGISNREVEHTVPIFTAAQETLFSTLHEMCIDYALGNQKAQIVPVLKAKGICIGLSLRHGEYKALVSSHPLLSTVPVTNKIGFPDVILPGYIRNDLYVIVEGGEFSQDRKTRAKNIEVLVQVRLESGEPIKDCIYIGTGEKPRSEFRSIVYYHSNNPHWMEPIKVVVPISQLPLAWLFFCIRHCTTTENKEKLPFAEAFLKLTNPDGTVVADKSHTLPCFKPLKEIEPTASIFIPIPSTTDPKFPWRKGESLKVRTVLCSTMSTQNISLLSLLKWREYPGDLADVLNRFTFVDQIEIIKFMQEIFDAMFGILDVNRVKDPDLVFNAIIFIIGLLVGESTSRYTNFRPVLDTYIERHFSGTQAHNHLIKCLERIFKNVTSKSLKMILTTLKSLEYIFKFIVASRRNYTKTKSLEQGNTSNATDEEFKTNILSVFSSFIQLMKRTEREYIGAQTIATKNFTNIFSDLEEILTIAERSQLASDFVDSIAFDESRPLLNMEKLMLIQKLVEGDLFLDETARSIMLPTVCKHWTLHMDGGAGDTEEISRCAHILCVMLDSIQTKIKDHTQIYDIVGVLPGLLTSIKTMNQCAPLKYNSFADRDTERSRLDLIHCLLSVFHLMDAPLFSRYTESLPDTDSIREFLYNVFTLLESLLSNGAMYPDNWLVLSLFQFATIRKVLLITGKIVEEKISSNIQIDQQKKADLWGSLFKLATTFLKAKGIALERFGEPKQKLIRTKYGDMRLEVIELLQNLWYVLGPLKALMLEKVVGPFLEIMVLVDAPSIKQTALDMYFDLIESEYESSQSFTRVESETINTVDRISSTSEQGTTTEIFISFKDFFTKGLDSKLQKASSKDGNMSTKGKKFLKDTSTFLELLFALRTLPDSPEYEDDRTIATMKLMEYLKQTGRKDTYVRYVHMLCNQHLSSNNFTEAGLTLLLHADLLAWDYEKLPETKTEEAGVSFPAETARARKERLYNMAVGYLDKGKNWEEALQLLDELHKQYEEVIFDYAKLADVLNMESVFFRKIINTERFFAEYFRVGYYGRGFDSNLQGKEFVYRGFELERMADFVQRIQIKFPNAKLLTYTETPPPEILSSNGQYLQVYAVKPSPLPNSIELNHQNKEKKPTKKIPSQPVTSSHPPPMVAKYHQYNNVNTFLYSKPFRKGPKEKGAVNEFKDLWIMSNYFVTEDHFPTIHRRSEIVHQYEVELSPVDNALNTIEGKNQELKEMNQKYDPLNGGGVNISPFTMVLKGVIDAAVNGGVTLYKQAFFVPEYLEKNPDKEKQVTRLRLGLNEQVTILDLGLKIHAQVCPPEMSGLQEQLEGLFVKMRQEIEEEESQSRKSSLDSNSKDLPQHSSHSPPPPSPSLLASLQNDSESPLNFDSSEQSRKNEN